MKITLQDNHATIIAGLLATSIKDQRAMRDLAQHRIDTAATPATPPRVTDGEIVAWCDEAIDAYQTTLDAIKKVW
ncbi:Uncharacterised protein [Mycobacteroides abscessus subsp. abscessus]|nr:Uncharacterised protein [Mycobacteroides abscessus subsp. abscessus]